jgi:hypothetical protein
MSVILGGYRVDGNWYYCSTGGCSLRLQVFSSNSTFLGHLKIPNVVETKDIAMTTAAHQWMSTEEDKNN